MTQSTDATKMITVDREMYDELVERAAWLNYLEMAGVDNWEGYSYAQDLRTEQEGMP